MRGQMLPTTFDSTHFYAVTPQQLLKYISQFDSCLLYFWDDHCPGRLCLSPLVYQQFCDLHGYKFIFISKGYYHVRYIDQFTNGVDYPYFCINSFIYNTDNVLKYLRKFNKEMVGKEFKWGLWDAETRCGFIVMENFPSPIPF
jgi:hypothetical protein